MMRWRRMQSGERSRDGGDGGHRAAEVFAAFLRLGLTSFGGPVAHLGFFRQAFVHERGWLDERSYAELVALCQFLPGPTSSQVGFAVGLHRGGVLAACLGSFAFTLPSAALMVALGLGVAAADIGDWEPLFQGFKAAAVAVVAWALWGMARTLCPDGRTRLLALLACGVVLVAPTLAGQLAAIALGAAAGGAVIQWRPDEGGAPAPLAVRLGRRGATAAAVAFAGLLAGLPLLAALVGGVPLVLADALYRAGALVFGGGHVVLPLLQTAVVEPGLIDTERFLAGYGLAQALPGPLFAFGGYIGAVAGGLGLALLGTIAVFLPGFLLVLALLPLWERLRADPRVRRPLAGVDAAVVGILAAALWDPVLRHGVTTPGDGLIAAAALALLAWGRVPVWGIVAGCGLAAFGAATL